MAEDYRVATGWRTHPKRAMLHAELGPGAVLAVMDLWSFCRSTRPDGDLSGLTDQAIEIACGWPGDGRLVDAMARVGLIDGGASSRSVHDWSDHNPYSARSGSRRRNAQAMAYKRWHREGRHQHSPAPGCPLCDATHDAAGNACGSATGNAPYPYPDPYPLPTPVHAGGTATGIVQRVKPILLRGQDDDLESAWRPGEPVRTLLDFEVATQQIHAGIVDREEVKRILDAGEIGWHEMQYALEATGANGSGIQYLIAVIKGRRRRKASAGDDPVSPPVPEDERSAIDRRERDRYEYMRRQSSDVDEEAERAAQTGATGQADVDTCTDHAAHVVGDL